MTRSRSPGVFPTMHVVAGHFEEGLPARDVSWGAALRAPFDALAAGDSAALEAIWDLSSRRLYGLALWRTGCEEDARDVVQEVFVRLASRRSDLSGVEKPHVWLLAVAHNAAVDAVRRSSRHRTEPLESAAHVAAPGIDPERAAAASRTSRALAQLPHPNARRFFSTTSPAARSGRSRRSPASPPSLRRADAALPSPGFGA